MFKYHKSFLRLLKSLNFNPYKSTLRLYSDAAECTEEKLIYSIPPFLKLPPKNNEFKTQCFDYLLVLDFEATCDSPAKLLPQEIIEFPVLKVNCQTFDVESSFQSYVRPTIHPKLTKFCSELTGITQETVDNSPVFEDVYESFQMWLQNEHLLDKNVKLAFATCGDWDLKYIFPMQCKGLQLPVPSFMKKWINVKYSFSDLTSMYPRNMITMIKYCQLEHEGRLHSGLDDCKNIARVLKNLAQRGVVFICNAGIH